MRSKGCSQWRLSHSQGATDTKFAEMPAEDLAKVKSIALKILNEYTGTQSQEDIIPLVMALGMSLGFLGDTYFAKASPDEFGEQMGNYITQTIKNARSVKEVTNGGTGFKKASGWGNPN